MSICALNHFTVMSADLAATREFYCAVLGMEEGPRPHMNFPGLWLYADGAPILHVIATEEKASGRNTAIDHVAFTATALRDVSQRMDARALKYSLRRMADGGWQLFCRDPDGALIELDFAADEAGPDA